MSAKTIKVRDGFLEPLKIVNAIEAYVALAAQQTANALSTTALIWAARMIVIYAKSIVSFCGILHDASTNTTTSSLRFSFGIKPRLIDVILVERNGPYLTLHPFRSAPLLQFGISLKILISILFACNYYPLSIPLIVFACAGVNFLAVLSRPFRMQGRAALFALRVEAVLTVLSLMEFFKRKIEQAPRTLPRRDGVNFIGRGHVAPYSDEALSLVLQHLTPTFYYCEAAHGC